MRFSEEEEMLVRGITLTVVCMSAVLCLACSKAGSEAGGDKSSTPNTPNSAAEPAKPRKSDPCALLTQTDATALFGKPAATYKGGAKTPDSRLNACGWDYVYPDNSSHLLQLVVYDSDIAYSQDPASTPFAIGDKGNVMVSDLSGVDVMWVQKGKTYSLSYFTVGPSAVPDDTTKAEQVKALAKTIAARL
jgi:hypothetical protein